MTRPATTVALSLLLAGAVGCSGGRRTAQANHELRLEREALLERVAELESQVGELEVKLEAASSGRGLDPDRVAALPVVSEVLISGTSGFRRDGGVTVLVAARDGRSVDVQAVGTLVVELRRADEDSAEATELIATQALTETELRSAYRTGLFGSGYEVRFPPSDVAEARALVVIARLKDSVTGATHEATGTIESAVASSPDDARADVGP